MAHAARILYRVPEVSTIHARGRDVPAYWYRAHTQIADTRARERETAEYSTPDSWKP